MVSKASDDLPDPESPVKTMIRSRGSSSETFFRLCSRAPRITSLSLTLVTIPAQGSEHTFPLAGGEPDGASTGVRRYDRVPMATWTPVPDPAPHGTLPARSSRLIVVATVLLAGVWPAAWALRQGDISALVGPGVTGPSIELLAREVPGLVVGHNAGHDGQQFYAIARKPFDPRHTARYLTTPSYRYRRILFPLMGWALAPHGGRQLILALAAIGLMSVALSAASLRALPGSPPWLPLIVAGTPGVVASLMLGLSDTLALALTLVAFAAAAHRRWAVLVVALVLAALAKETAFLAASALALAPGLPGRAGLGGFAAAAIVLGGWV